jgi:hypothetical protein
LPLSTNTLKKRLARQNWTSHNIRLNGEITTLPENYDFLRDDRLKAIERVFRLVFGGGIAGKRIADLGCLEGGFAVAFASQGAAVTGVEARRANIEKLFLLKDHFDDLSLEFALADVKDFTVERFGLFDAVLALGILYHLDNPVEWLRQIGKTTRRLLVVDTHFAPADDLAFQQIDPRIGALGEIEKVEFAGSTYSGRWFKEFEPATDPEPQIWASFSNWRSFWLLKESLVRAIRDAGFDLVFEQHDYSMDNYQRLSVESPRILIVAAKIEKGPA